MATNNAEEEVTLSGRKYTLSDADTWIDRETGKVYRGKGYDAEEVYHAGTKEDPMKSPETMQGYMQTQIVADMMREKGFDELKEDGTGYYGRTLGVPYNEETNTSVSRKLHSEGLTRLNRYTSVEDQEAYWAGKTARHLFGDDPDSYYGHAREALDASRKFDTEFVKGTADTEAEFAKKPWLYSDVMYRHEGRTLDNQATNSFGTGWDSGWNNIYGSLNGFKAALGDAMNNEEMYQSGVLGVEEYEYKNSLLPTYANDVGSIENIRDAGRYMAGMMGQAFPYIIGIAGSAVAGAYVAGPAAAGLAVGALPPAMTYAGEVYGSMEGEMDERNAATAMAAGIVMGVLDRVGLHGLLNSKSLLKDDAMKRIAVELQKKEGLTEAAAKAKVKSATFNVAKEVSDAAGRVAHIEMSKSLLAQEFGQSFLKGAASEGVTEGLQETTSYAASVAGSKKEWKEEDYKRILMNAVTGGALLGGAMGGAITTSQGVGSFKSQQRKFSQAADDVTKDFFGEGNTLEQLSSWANDLKMNAGFNNQEAVRRSHESYKKGQKADTVKEKGWFKTAVELPGKAVQKGGSRMLEKIMDNPEISDSVKHKVAILKDNFAPSNKSHMAGMAVAKYKTVLMHSLLNHADMMKSEFISIFNTKRGDKNYDAKMKDFEAWQKETDAKQLDGPMHKKYRHLTEKLNILHERINDSTSSLWQTHKNMVGDSRTPLEGYFYKSAVFNPNAVRKNKEMFVSTLVNGWTSPSVNGKPGETHKLSKAEAHQLWSDVVNGPEGYAHDATQDLGFKHRKAGTLRKTKLSIRDSQIMNDMFLEKDHFEKLKFNITSTINHDVDLMTLGKDGSNLDRMLLDLEEEMGDQWDPRINTLIKDSVAAGRGDYKPIKNKFLSKMQGHLTFVGTITMLDTSVLASLPEIGLLLLNAPKYGGVLGLIRNGSRDLKKHYKRSLIETAQHVKSGLGLNMDEYTQNQLDFYNFGYDSAKHGVMGHMDIGQEIEHMSKFKQNMLQVFFTMNLLKPFTDGSRVVKLSMAQDAIVDDLYIVSRYLDEGSNYAADAYERLRDLNVDPVKLAAEYKAAIVLLRADPSLINRDAMYDRIANDKTGVFNPLLEQLKIARMSYVDNALANPNAIDRPLWYSNPHFRLMTQFQGFLSTFTSHILPRIYRQVKHGNPEARYQAVAMAATMIMFGMLGQDLKDEWKYEDGENPWIKPNMGFERALYASGLLGTTARLAEIVHPIYDFKQDLAGLATDIAGPFTGTLATGKKIVESVLDGDGARAAYYAKKNVFLIGRYHGFNQRGGSSESGF